MSPLLKSFYRYTFGLLGLGAIITEIIALVSRHSFNAVNFFSFFTIQSNILSVVMLLLFGTVTTHKKLPHSLVVFKGATTLYMLMTGVIFALLLAPIEDAVLTAVPWDNIVLHYILPVVVVMDWLFMQPRVTISFRQSVAWLLFPTAYVIYSLIRGEITDWYPYPFLDAHTHGYTHVLGAIVVLLVFVVAASQVLRRVAARKSL